MSAGRRSVRREDIMMMRENCLKAVQYLPDITKEWTMNEKYDPQFWCLQIKRTKNGWLVINSDREQYCFQEKGEKDLETFEEVLWELVHYFAMYAQPSDKKRISIEVKKNDDL